MSSRQASCAEIDYNARSRMLPSQWRAHVDSKLFCRVQSHASTTLRKAQLLLQTSHLTTLFGRRTLPHLSLSPSLQPTHPSSISLLPSPPFSLSHLPSHLLTPTLLGHRNPIRRPLQPRSSHPPLARPEKVYPAHKEIPGWPSRLQTEEGAGFQGELDDD